MVVNLDVVSVLRDLHFTVQAGIGGLWRIESPAGDRFSVSLPPSVERVSASTARVRDLSPAGGMRILLSGWTVTNDMLQRARRGELDVLTQDPPRLVIGGREFAVSGRGSADEHSTTVRRRRGRPAWIRWGVMRCLLLAEEPLRQVDVADALQVQPQSVSHAFHMLGPSIEYRAGRYAAANKVTLLELWVSEYPGPGGQDFGWFSLDPVVEQTRRAAEIAGLWEAGPLVSGDVAADRLAPWKLPTRGKIYVRQSFDLESDGFVPSPVDEATLIVSVPDDPTLWNQLADQKGASAREMTLADSAIVYWDLLQSDDPDSREAADKFAKLMVGETK